MSFVLKDRVKETSTTTGTGTFTLAGAATGFQSFSVIGNGNSTFYCIVDSAAGAWEVGIGTYTSSGTLLSRDTVLESSNSGSKVNFSAGTKEVFCTYPAEKSVTLDDVQTLSNKTLASPSVTGSITFNDASTQSTAATGFGFKNRIINGAMVIDKRNAGASVTTYTASTTKYTLDRWGIFGTLANKFTTQQTPSATETGYATRVAAGFTNYLAITSSAATSAGSTDEYEVHQKIEGFNTADFAWGTANAKSVTISFLVYSSLTGTFGGSVTNGGYNRSYPFSYTISAANTWEQKTVTIAGDTSGTWLTTNGTGLFLCFDLGSGSSLKTTANTWAAGYYTAPTGATSVVGTSGATFYITGVQLEKGSTATSFDYRPYGTELALCQRYYARFNSLGGSYRGVGTGVSESATSISCVVKYPVTMRSGPTASGANMATYDGSSVRAITAFSTQYTGSDGLNINLTVGGGGMTTNRPANLVTDNSGTGYFELTAEL